MLTKKSIFCAYPGDDEDDDIQVDCDVLQNDGGNPSPGDADYVVDLFAWRPYNEEDPLSGGDRGWVDFSAVVDESGPIQDDCIDGGCDANEIRCLITEGSNALLEPPLCIPGASGIKGGAVTSSHFDDVVGTFASLPVFHKVGCEDCPEEGQDQPVPASNNCGGGGNEPINFCVDSFACARVVGYEKGITLCNAVDPTDCSTLNNAKLLKFQLECGEQACQTNLGYTDPGQTGNPFSPNAVTLTK
jgi:hypothetical protein